LFTAASKIRHFNHKNQEYPDDEFAAYRCKIVFVKTEALYIYLCKIIPLKNRMLFLEEDDLF